MRRAGAHSVRIRARGVRSSMALRWYTIVVDCRDPKAQAQWWAEVLGWHKIYEADDEVVLVPEWVTMESVKTTPWDRQSQGLVFGKVPEEKTVKNRLHIDLAPHTSHDRDAEIERLLSMGATRVNVGPDRRGGLGRLRRPRGQRVLRPVVARVLNGRFLGKARRCASAGCEHRRQRRLLGRGHREIATWP